MEKQSEVNDLDFDLQKPYLTLHSSMMRDKTIWGPDANEFNPDRWLDADEEAIAELDRYYMPVSQSLFPSLHSSKKKHQSPSLERTSRNYPRYLPTYLRYLDQSNRKENKRETDKPPFFYIKKVRPRLRCLPWDQPRQDRALQGRCEHRPGLRHPPGRSEAGLELRGLLQHAAAQLACVCYKGGARVM